MTVRREKRSQPARRRGAPVCAVSGKIRYRDGHQAALALKGLRRPPRADRMAPAVRPSIPAPGGSRTMSRGVGWT